MLRQEVNKFQLENNTLHESVNELETKVTAYVIVVNGPIVLLTSRTDLFLFLNETA